MSDKHIPDFDFDEMVKLATEDPVGFEARREQLIGAAIANSSPEHQRRLQGLQWQVDQVRQSLPNAMASCIKLSRMMWDSVLKEDGLLDNLQRLQSAEQPRPPRADQTASVIQLFDAKPLGD